MARRPSRASTARSTRSRSASSSTAAAEVVDGASAAMDLDVVGDDAPQASTSKTARGGGGLMFGDEATVAAIASTSKLAFPPPPPPPAAPPAAASTMFATEGGGGGDVKPTPLQFNQQTSETAEAELSSILPNATATASSSRPTQWFNEPIREYTDAEVLDWRTEMIERKQQELADIVDRHDDYVRELFHLDRFVTLVGFDPAVAKEDKSDVFLSFQHEYDLFANAVPDTTDADRAGGRRASRRAATTHRKSFSEDSPPMALHAYPTVSAAAPAALGVSPFDLKGKGRAADVWTSGRLPPVTTQWTSSGVYWTQEAEDAARRRGELGFAVGSGGRGGYGFPPKGSTVNTKPVIATLTELSRKYYAGGRPPESTVGHVPKKRRVLLEGEVEPTFSHHQQIPPDPPHDFSLQAVLNSFYTWVNDDDGELEGDGELVEPVPDESEMDERAANEADIFDQVEKLRAKGIELLNPDQEKQDEPPRADDHRDHLIAHAIHFGKLVQDERKAHLAIARKLGRMVLAHFAGIRGKEEKAVREEEKLKKALARWTMKEVRKKWKLALNVVKARRRASEKEERDRLGKEQLNAMLDKSTTMLQKQQVEMAGDSSASEAGSASVSGDGAESASEEEAEEKGEEEEGEEEEAHGDEDGAVSARSESEALQDTPPVAAKSPPPRVNGFGASRKRSLRSRASSRSASAATPAGDSSSAASPAATADDPDADGDDDDVFDAADAERDAEDAAMQAAMEQEELQAAADDEDSEAELGGLAAEAEMPIEELLRRSGYGAMLEAEAAAQAAQENGAQEEESGAEMEVDEEEEEEEEEEEKPLVALVNGHTAGTNGDLTAEEAEAAAMSEFGSSDDDKDAARDDEDGALEREMEAEEGDAKSDDGEMKGLAEDADMPIDELMRKYGYGGGDVTADGTGTPASGSASVAEVDEEGDEEEGSEANDSAMDQDEDGETGSVNGQPQHEDSPAVKAVNLRPPFLLRGSLRPYQQAGLEWLASLYAGGVNGILADEMGLGKTIQTISLLAHLACDKGQWGPHLVVVPTSVMLNWEMEFKKFLPGFKILTYYGSQKQRKEKRQGWNTENHFHVCITSYQLVLADQHMFRRKPWHYMILDEAHHIKNFRSQRWQTLLGFNARHRLLLTGTPLQNNLMELWSLLYFLMPHGLVQDGKGPFADHADFQAWFSNPMEKAIETEDVMDEETKATVAKLHTVLRPYLLRRLKAEVETQMPGKTESVIYCRLSKRQRFLYDEFMSRAQTRETLGSGHFLSIINCLMQLRKVCNHPDLFEVRPIVTSFAMNRSVANEYEPKELLVRKRLLMEEPIAQMDWSSLTLVRPDREADTSSIAARTALEMDAAPQLPSLHELPDDFYEAAPPPQDMLTILGWKKHYDWSLHQAALSRLRRLSVVNSRRCRNAVPYFGRELLHTLRAPSREHTILPSDVPRHPHHTLSSSTLVPKLVQSTVERAARLSELVSKYAFVTPAVKAADMPRHALAGASPLQIREIEENASADLLHRASVKLSVAFPDRSLLQYDCGKLQKLDELLRECKAGGHRALIFTQMTKVLDILEEFLSFHGHRYMRLDGSTKIEQRQIITERFNSDDSILCFISSTRAGGLGINLQGADTVIFYDSDWNPALDRQCQDRAHRIGQTREVRIWRFVTEHSIEENMLKKANQKRRLDELVIAEGDFTTDYLQKLDWRDYLDEQQLEELGVDQQADADNPEAPVATQSAQEIRQALAAAEDEEDAAAARAAVAEMDMDRSDFDGGQQQQQQQQAQSSAVGKVLKAEGSATPSGGARGTTGSPAPGTPAEEEEDEEEDDPLKGTVDGFMLKIADRYYDDLS